MHFIPLFAPIVTILSFLSVPTTAQIPNTTPLNTIACYQCLEKAAIAIAPSCAGLVSSPLSAIINPFTLTDTQKSCYCGIGSATTSWAMACEAPEICDSSTMTQYIQSFAVLKSTVCLATDIGNTLVGGASTKSAGNSLLASPFVKIAAGLMVTSVVIIL